MRPRAVPQCRRRFPTLTEIESDSRYEVLLTRLGYFHDPAVDNHVISQMCDYKPLTISDEGLKDGGADTHMIVIKPVQAVIEPQR